MFKTLGLKNSWVSFGGFVELSVELFVDLWQLTVDLLGFSLSSTGSVPPKITPINITNAIT